MHDHTLSHTQTVTHSVTQTRKHAHFCFCFFFFPVSRSLVALEHINTHSSESHVMWDQVDLTLTRAGVRNGENSSNSLTYPTAWIWRIRLTVVMCSSSKISQLVDCCFDPFVRQESSTPDVVSLWIRWNHSRSSQIRPAKQWLRISLTNSWLPPHLMLSKSCSTSRTSSQSAILD